MPTPQEGPMFKLIPTNHQFFDLFDRSTEILVTASRSFSDFLENFQHPERHADEIKQFEHEADEVTHDAMELLHQSFITPLERMDIRRLIESLDDVLDFLDDAARRIVLYEIAEILPEAKDLAKVLVESTLSVAQAVGALRRLNKQSKEILQYCIEIRRLENEGDRINHELLAKLFKSHAEPFLVLKWKEIIDDIETAIDRCQDVANVVEGIVLENS
jgi:predicted phosphate transport protein (TIGR00153 family)